ncbi:hypothetical protein NDU88_008004 [Pleurodeles waltl]|uniref:Uncharacterized protein n=1 Tax=Pleurodeles waltl TaxID=8319 RepID=A0AAV7U1H3_PLEWA|nr:hypothetical protein NDU88_008004 [Pleurodeles waltl]
MGCGSQGCGSRKTPAGREGDCKNYREKEMLLQAMAYRNAVHRWIKEDIGRQREGLQEMQGEGMLPRAAVHKKAESMRAKVHPCSLKEELQELQREGNAALTRSSQEGCASVHQGRHLQAERRTARAAERKKCCSKLRLTGRLCDSGSRKPSTGRDMDCTMSREKETLLKLLITGRLATDGSRETPAGRDMDCKSCREKEMLLRAAAQGRPLQAERGTARAADTRTYCQGLRLKGDPCRKREGLQEL